jgi:MoxR-like ATPase
MWRALVDWLGKESFAHVVWVTSGSSRETLWINSLNSTTRVLDVVGIHVIPDKTIAAVCLLHRIVWQGPGSARTWEGGMMPSGELLRQIFRGYVKRDDRVFRSAAEEMIRDERAKNHRLLADDLERILLNGYGLSMERRLLPTLIEVPKDKERGFPLLDITEYSYEWDRIILSSKSERVLQQIALEHKKMDLLASAGVKPKQRVLFCGPPGCGKTLAAQVLASVLGYPLVTVRFDAVVSSYLGETAANLRRVFEFIQRGQWVVLFDEFDAIGKDRDNPLEHGELKRVVNSLLQLMDAFSGESLLIAATNHERLLDAAIWRRFDAVVPFGLPTYQDRLLMMRQFLRGFAAHELDSTRTARALKGATGADVEWMVTECVRRAVLDGRSSVAAEDLEFGISAYRERVEVLRSVAGYQTDQEPEPAADAD